MKEVEIPIEICRKGAVIPQYQNLWDAGMDVCAAEDVKIGPGETVVIPTGLKFAIPEGYEIQVRPRSGISLKTPLRVSNSPGTIDSGYRDELGIIISNTSDLCGCDHASFFTLNTTGNQKGVYTIFKGDRIAQLVLKEVPRMKFKVVPSVSEIGEDRGGGFGSTGI
ncbi:MAG: aminotransferase [Clostridiaceae bacterium]|nr:aminotransferase [Clostridiaceae bacterium]